MSNAIKVTPVLTIGAFKDGSAIRVSTTKPEWGSVMLNHHSFSFIDGAMYESRRVAFFRAKLSNLDLIVKGSSEIKADEDFNAKLTQCGFPAHKIVRRETFEPQYEGHQPKMNPSKNNELILVDGKQVYMQDIAIPVTDLEGDTLLRSSAAVAATETVVSEAIVEEGQVA